MLVEGHQSRLEDHQSQAGGLLEDRQIEEAGDLQGNPLAEAVHQIQDEDHRNLEEVEGSLQARQVVQMAEAAFL